MKQSNIKVFCYLYGIEKLRSDLGLKTPSNIYHMLKMGYASKTHFEQIVEIAEKNNFPNAREKFFDDIAKNKGVK